MRARVREYLSKNWGAPFVAAFMALLAVSAAELSLGLADEANTAAVYGFYSLVVGVVLQIASYVKFGEGVSEEVAPPSEVHLPPVFARWSRRKKAITAGILVIVVLGAGVALAYPRSPLGEPFKPTYAKLTVRVGYTSAVRESSGSTVVAFGVNVLGGSLPYTFTTRWPDNINQTDSTGTFTRMFLSNQTVFLNANVTVKSADGQKETIQVSINSTAK